MLPQNIFHTKFYSLENLPQLVSFIQQQTCQLLGWSNHYQDLLNNTHYASSVLINTYFPYQQAITEHKISPQVTICQNSDQIFKFTADQLLRSATKPLSNYLFSESIDNPSLIKRNQNSELFINLDCCKLPLTQELLTNNVNLNIFAKCLEYYQEVSSTKNVQQVFRQVNNLELTTYINVWSLQQFLLQTIAQTKLGLVTFLQNLTNNSEVYLANNTNSSNSSNSNINSATLNDVNFNNLMINTNSNTINHLTPDFDYNLKQIQQGFLGTSLLNPAFYHRLEHPNTPYSASLSTETAGSINSYYNTNWFNEVNPRFYQILPRQFDLDYSEQELKLIDSIADNLNHSTDYMNQQYIEVLTSIYHSKFNRQANDLFNYYNNSNLTNLTQADLLDNIDLANDINNYANSNLWQHLVQSAHKLVKSNTTVTKPSDFAQVCLENLIKQLTSIEQVQEFIEFCQVRDSENQSESKITRDSDSTNDIDSNKNSDININNNSNSETKTPLFINYQHLNLIVTKLLSQSFNQVFSTELSDYQKVALHFYLYYLGKNSNLNSNLDTGTSLNSNNNINLEPNTESPFFDETELMYALDQKLALTCHHLYRFSHKQAQFLASPYRQNHQNIFKYACIVDSDALLSKNWLSLISPLLQQNTFNTKHLYQFVNINPAVTTFNSNFSLDQKLPPALISELNSPRQNLIKDYIKRVKNSNVNTSISDNTRDINSIENANNANKTNTKLANYLVLSPYLDPINLNHHKTALGFENSYFGVYNLTYRLLLSNSNSQHNQGYYHQINAYYNCYGATRDLTLSNLDQNLKLATVFQRSELEPIYFSIDHNQCTLSNTQKATTKDQLDGTTRNLNYLLDHKYFAKEFKVQNPVIDKFMAIEQALNHSHSFTQKYLTQQHQEQSYDQDTIFQRPSTLAQDLDLAQQHSTSFAYNSSKLTEVLPKLQGFNLNLCKRYRLFAQNPLLITDVRQLSSVAHTTPANNYNSSTTVYPNVNTNCNNGLNINSFCNPSTGLLGLGLVHSMIKLSLNSNLDLLEQPAIEFINTIPTYQTTPTTQAYLFNIYLKEFIHQKLQQDLTWDDILASQDYLTQTASYNPFTSLSPTQELIPELSYNTNASSSLSSDTTTVTNIEKNATLNSEPNLALNSITNTELSAIESRFLLRTNLGTTITNQHQPVLELSSDHGRNTLEPSGHYFPILAQANSYNVNEHNPIFYCLTDPKTSFYSNHNLYTLQTQQQQLQHFKYELHTLDYSHYQNLNHEQLAQRLGDKTKTLSPVYAYNLLAIKEIFAEVANNENLDLQQMITIIPSCYSLNACFSQVMTVMNTDSENEFAIYDPQPVESFRYGLTSYKQVPLIQAYNLLHNQELTVNYLNSNQLPTRSYAINQTQNLNTTLESNSNSTFRANLSHSSHPNSNLNLALDSLPKSPLQPSFIQAQAQLQQQDCGVAIQLNLVHNPYIILALGTSFLLSVYQSVNTKDLVNDLNISQLLSSLGIPKLNANLVTVNLPPNFNERLNLNYICPQLQTKFSANLTDWQLWPHCRSLVAANQLLEFIHSYQRSDDYQQLIHPYRSLVMNYGVGQVTHSFSFQNKNYHQWQLKRFKHLNIEHKYPIILYSTLNRWNPILYCFHANLDCHNFDYSLRGVRQESLTVRLQNYISKLYFTSNHQKTTLTYTQVSPDKLYQYFHDAKLFNSFNINCFSISRRLILLTKHLWQDPNFMVRDLIEFLANSSYKDNSNHYYNNTTNIKLITKIALPNFNIVDNYDNSYNSAHYSKGLRANQNYTRPSDPTKYMQSTLHIRYLNLEQQSDRKLQLEQFLSQAQIPAQMLGWNLEFKRVPAVLGKALTSQELQQTCDLTKACRKYRRFMSDGEIGVSLSMLKNFRQISQDPSIGDTDYVLCLEDDVCADSNWVEQIYKLITHLQQIPCQHPPRLVNLGHYRIEQGQFFDYGTFRKVAFPKFKNVQSQLNLNEINLMSTPKFNSAGGFAYLIRKDLAIQIIQQIDAKQIKLSWLADDFIEYPGVRNIDYALASPTVFFVNNITDQTNLSSSRTSLNTYVMYLTY